MQTLLSDTVYHSKHDIKRDRQKASSSVAMLNGFMLASTPYSSAMCGSFVSMQQLQEPRKADNPMRLRIYPGYFVDNLLESSASCDHLHRSG